MDEEVGKDDGSSPPLTLALGKPSLFEFLSPLVLKVVVAKIRFWHVRMV